jgi:D-arginine dehydrogenase
LAAPDDRAADFIIVGAGIAGASLAYELAPHGRAILLEREDQPGYHTTGRSAALYSETYGNATMRALTRAGREFFLSPPSGFTASPILTPRGTLVVATAAQRATLEKSIAEMAGTVPGLELWSGAQARARVPVYTADQVDCALWEPHAMDIDVHALHQGYLRGARQRGCALHCSAEVLAMQRTAGRWSVHTSAGDFHAPVVVNAAGAWADTVAAIAGARALGVQPLRRTVITFDAAPGMNIHDWPAVIDADETYYFKPEAGRVLASLADETPSPPCDAQPDEYDIALLIDRVTRATTFEIRKIHSKWAGLRSFVADRTLVAGYDPLVEGFFWLAAQGGYGIQTSSGASRAAATLVIQRSIPAELRDLGVLEADLAPRRFSEPRPSGEDCLPP